MAENTNRKLTTFRLPPTVLDAFTNYAKKVGQHKTAILEEMVVALLEGRLTIHPRGGANAFPGDEVPAGSSPECPAHIAFLAEN